MYRSKNTLYSGSRSGSGSGAPTPSSSSSKRPSQPAPGEAPHEPSSSSSSDGLDERDVPSPPPADSPAASVEEALQKAQAALAAAESHLSSIETLQPQLSTRWTKALQVVKLLALAAATAGLLVTSHAFGLTWQWVSAVAAGVGVAGGCQQRGLVFMQCFLFCACSQPGSSVQQEGCLAQQPTGC